MTTGKLPLVSLVITSYNRGHLISKAIESALAQDYPNLEIIISDNCSTDNTDSVIQQYTHDPRIKYSRNATNIGMLPNFRHAAYNLAKGEYITFVSSDDYLIDPTFVSDSIQLVNKYDNVLLVFARGRMLNLQQEVLSETPEIPFFVQEFWNGKDVFFKGPDYGFLTWCACIMQKEAFRRVQALVKDYPNADLESNYKIMPYGNACFMNRFSHAVVSHGGNASTSVNANDKVLFLACLDDISQYARTVMPAENARIDKWRHSYLFSTAYNELQFLKIRSKKEFETFRVFVKKNYPDIYKAIHRRWRYRAYMLYWTVKNMFSGSRT